MIGFVIGVVLTLALVAVAFVRFALSVGRRW